MTNLSISGQTTAQANPANRIFCPAVAGLTAAQADLAFVMPRLDHNRALQEAGPQGGWAAVLASDPFGSRASLLRHIKDMGYRGITNWPSSILLDGSLKQSMSTIPASPASEYEFLAYGQEAGFEALAFFLSLEQARAATDAGLTNLILHPGILEIETAENSAMVLKSLQRLIDTVKQENTELSVLVYTSAWHEQKIALSTLQTDGFVWFEAPA